MKEGKHLRRQTFKLFLFLEAMLLLLTLFLLIKNNELLAVIIGGSILLKLGSRKGRKNGLLFWIGLSLIIFSLLSVFTVWFMLILAVFYLIMNGDQLFSDLNISNWVDFPWNKKSYTGIEVERPIDHSGERLKQKWMGNQTIGNHIFEWNNINMSVLMGDTIIDLGNTLLPAEENIILIRKGFGQTRIIVPAGVGVSLHHSALQGQVTFQHETYQLSNETLILYSDDYAEASRKIKIVSNSFFGDFEVIYL
jgi:lia operon protein LiaF